MPDLPRDAEPRLLDPRAADGWGAALDGTTPAHALLGVFPEVRFRGGREALLEAERWLAQFRGGPPLDALLIGSLAYELGHEWLSGRVTPRAEPALPAVDLAGFRAAYLHDPDTNCGRVVGGSARAVARLEELLRGLPAPAERGPGPRLGAARSGFTEPDYLSAVRAIQRYIRAGDVYQVNLARRLELPAPARAELRRLYQRLADATGAPFCAYLETPDRTLLSSSPELFLRSRGAEVETRPIKGTRPRGRTPAEDAALQGALVSSAKDRAEHVMIVDLERNDLGRVCELGSVRVRELCQPRSFSDVHHLVSAVRGRLCRPSDWLALLAATFPGGSITGAPKLRAMQIIAELEPVPRDVYTGSIGWIDAAGQVELSIAIRTALAVAGSLELHLGGGIVADSDPEAELRETLDKGRGFARSWDFSL
ncbi:MAG TPA: anthranilate synthase component I family protein [Myxococcota bacterium]|nr:anthranilate synthase component I family protein [Myxococcota bacterium]